MLLELPTYSQNLRQIETQVLQRLTTTRGKNTKGTLQMASEDSKLLVVQSIKLLASELQMGFTLQETFYTPCI